MPTRTPKEQRKPVDMAKILPSLQELGEAPDSCLGVEYDALAQECRSCADSGLCLAYFRNHITSKVMQVLPDVPFVDVADFSLITDVIQQKMLGVIRARQDENNPAPVTDFIQAVKTISKCQDDVAIVEWFKRFMTNNGLCTKNGFITFAHA